MDEHEVITTIKSGKAKMRSRTYFVARAVFVALGAIILFILIFLAVTFIVFALHENGGLFAARFGAPGWGIFFASLPWTMLLLSLALILILWLLLRRYSVVYYQPVAYVFLSLAVLVALGSLFFSADAIHGSIYRYVSQNQIPFVSGLYQFETTPARGVYRGEVVALATSTLVIEGGLGQTSTVILAPTGYAELAMLELGDFVLVFGHAINTSTIQASGVERIVNYED